MKDQDLDILRKHVAQISEHFDTVQIFCTRLIHKGTVTINYGSGNWFARYGQVSKWIIQEESSFVEEQEEQEEDDEELD